jgi:hypothetical protein
MSAAKALNLSGMIAMSVVGSPSSRNVLPTIRGSAPKSLCHSRRFIANTGTAPGRPSSAVKDRPRSGGIPR